MAHIDRLTQMLGNNDWHALTHPPWHTCDGELVPIVILWRAEVPSDAGAPGASYSYT